MWRDGVVLRLAKSGSSTVEGGFSSFLILGSSARQAGHPPSSIADLALIHATISLTAALLRYISHSVRRLLRVRAAIRTVVPSPWISYDPSRSFLIEVAGSVTGERISVE